MPGDFLLIKSDLAFLFVGGHQRGSTVQRRYSEFAFLWDCLVRRYPFRLLPQLPPKRIGRRFLFGTLMEILIEIFIF
jgi:hypothetical protein